MANVTHRLNAAPGLRLLRVLATGMLAASTFAAAQVQSDVSAADPDPPARAGRISLLSGPVTFTDFRTDEEFDATLNWPITSQQRLATGRQGRAEVRIGSTAIRLDGETVVDFNRIDDEVIQFTVQRGSAAVRVRNRDKLHEIDVLTPRERIAFEDVGRYRIDVNRTPGVTAVTAFVGTARISGEHMSFVVKSGQRGELTATPTVGFQLLAATPDVFDDWVAQRDRRDDAVRSTRYVSPEMTGVESLDDYGEWRTIDTYGAVWFPAAVPVGWVPYRHGRWAYVPPWGWTWIDDAPWGFAPFHYGRWVYIRNAWAWVPGAYVARPCYAPALVAWYGTPGVSVSVSIGTVGWFPLGPGEVYIPAYRYSHRYIQYVNYGHVTNINVTVINPPPHYRYRQPNFSTWAPADAIVRRTPVKRVIQAAPDEWVKLPVSPQPPIRVSGEGRKFKTQVAAPTDSGRGGGSDNDGRTVLAPRVDAPVRVAPRGGEAHEREKPIRPPVARIAPGADERPQQPVQRAPRAIAPRIETPAPIERPRLDAPRVEAPQPPRPPKVVPINPTPAPTAEVGVPPRQFAPRAAPAPRAEAPVPRVAPPRRDQNDDALRPKPAPRERVMAQ